MVESGRSWEARGWWDGGGLGGVPETQSHAADTLTLSQPLTGPEQLSW